MAECTSGIDEMTITRLPILLGKGIPLFGALSHQLQCRQGRTDEYGNGLVKSRNERVREKAK